MEKKSSKVSPKDCTDEADCNVDNVDPVGDEKQQSEKSETDLWETVIKSRLSKMRQNGKKVKF